MKVKYDPNYGSDRDGNRGIPVWDAELDNSYEERQEIAEQIYNTLVTDNWIDLNHFNITLTHTVKNNCIYDEKYDETFCDEVEVEFDTIIAPINYMDIVIPMAIEQIDNEWSIEDVSHLLYLEEVLINANYKSEELTKAIEPFKDKTENEN